MRKARCRLPAMAAFGVVATVLGIVLGASPGRAAAVVNTPMYNPQTRSYFELVPVNAAEGDSDIAGSLPGMYWSTAEAAAEKRVFKGAHGRLAVMRDLATTEWIEANFHPPPTIWIGLRYLCTVHQLQWSDGTYFKPGEWQIWDRHWFQGVGGAFCHEQRPWAGVTLSADGFGVHWVSWGAFKTFENFLVEFPTGAP